MKSGVSVNVFNDGDILLMNTQSGLGLFFMGPFLHYPKSSEERFTARPGKAGIRV